MLTAEKVKKRLNEVDRVGLKCIDEKGYLERNQNQCGWPGRVCAEAVLSFNPLVIYWIDETHAYIENRLVGIQVEDLQFFQLDSSVPLYEDGFVANVGHKIKHTNSDSIKEIIRIDSNTRQVWYKKGGFDWFEDMKNYQEV